MKGGLRGPQGRTLQTAGSNESGTVRWYEEVTFPAFEAYHSRQGRPKQYRTGIFLVRFGEIEMSLLGLFIFCPHVVSERKLYTETH